MKKQREKSASTRRRMVKDLLGFGLGRISGLIYPLLIVAIVSRELEPILFGHLMALLALSMWVYLLTTYSFELTSTRRTIMADGSHGPQTEAEVVWAAQLALATIAGVGALIAANIVPTIGADCVGAGLAWFVGVLQAAVPRWFYRARHDMAQLVIWEWLPKIASLPFLYAAARWQGSLVTIMSVICVAGVVSFLLTAYPLLRKMKRFTPRFSQAWLGVKRDFSVFCGIFASSFYTVANIVLLGLFVSPAVVGFFAAADRIVRAVVACNAIVPQAFYASMIRLFGDDREKGISFLLLTLAVMLVVGLISAVAVYALAPYFVPLLLGEGYDDVVHMTQKMAWIIPLYALAHVLGTQGLLATGKNKSFTVVPVVCAIVNIGAIFSVVPRYGIEGMVNVVIFTTGLITLGYAALTVFHFGIKKN